MLSFRLTKKLETPVMAIKLYNYLRTNRKRVGLNSGQDSFSSGCVKNGAMVSRYEHYRDKNQKIVNPYRRLVFYVLL